MKNKGIKTIVAVISMILLAGIGWFFSERFLEIVIHQFDGMNVRFVSTEFLGQFQDARNFTSALALLPLLFLFSAYILSEEKKWKQALTFIIILSSGIGLLSYHIYSIKVEIVRYPNILGLENHIALSTIQIGWYLGIGFIIGTLVSNLFFLLVTSKKSQNG